MQPVPMLVIRGPKGVGKRHTITQALRRAVPEVEVFCVDWAVQGFRDNAAVVLADLQAVLRAGPSVVVFCE